MPSPRLVLTTRIESWPLRESFTISRGAKREAVVVVAELTSGTLTGRGECVPYPRYGETPENTCKTIDEALRNEPELDRARLQHLMPPSAARNALDCAFWALEARQRQTTVAALLGFAQNQPQLTCQTISLASPEAMAEAARRLRAFPLLKLKLGAPGDPERMTAVRAARPDARLVADVNEGWTPDRLPALIGAAQTAGIEMIEQPLPAGQDDLLRTIPHVVPICADESAHTTDGLADLKGAYDAVNIKLDKTGGLTGAMAMAQQAKAMGFKIMLGCMVSTSLSMAPALHLAPFADWIDLDGPLLLQRDRTPGLVYEDAMIHPPDPLTWG